MKDNMQRADEMLKLFAEEMASCRAEAFEYKEEPEKREVVYVNKKRTKTPLFYMKRVSIICICCISLFIGFGTVSSEANLAQLLDFIFNDKNNNTEMVSDEFPPIPAALYPTYIPEGYICISEVEIPGGYECIYENSNTGDVVSIMQLSESGTYTSVDIEDTTKTSCFVNDSQAYYVDSDGHKSLNWQAGETYFELSSSMLDMKELIKIAENLK